jgi:hypothetical protein
MASSRDFRTSSGKKKFSSNHYSGEVYCHTYIPSFTLTSAQIVPLAPIYRHHPPLEGKEID